VVALAAALKISPILLLGFFLAQRRWRAVWGAAVTGIVLLAVMLIGTGANSLGYFATQILPALGRGSAAFPNQSLLGVLYRFAVPLSAIQSADAIGDYPAVRAIWLMMSIGLTVVTLYLTARARLTERPGMAVAFSSYIVLGLIAGGLAWDHYFLWLSLPVCALLIDWFRDRWLRPIGFGGIFVLALFAIILPTPILEKFYYSVGAIGTALPLLGLVALLVMMWWRLRQWQTA
jgi:alpha-1,2-mannosyltransferase